MSSTVEGLRGPGTGRRAYTRSRNVLKGAGRSRWSRPTSPDDVILNEDNPRERANRACEDQLAENSAWRSRPPCLAEAARWNVVGSFGHRIDPPSQGVAAQSTRVSA